MAFRRPMIFAAVMLSAAFAFSVQVHATILNFEADLSGSQEVIPNVSPAFGTVDLTVDDSTGQVTVTSGTYSGLLTGSIFATLNGPAAPGVGASSLFSFTVDSPGSLTGTISGGGTLSGANLTSFLNGNTYINIGTSLLPAGEIRGQVVASVPEPATITLCAVGMCGLLTMGRRMRRQAMNQE